MSVMMTVIFNLYFNLIFKFKTKFSSEGHGPDRKISSSEPIFRISNIDNFLDKKGQNFRVISLIKNISGFFTTSGKIFQK